jgi:hypothetical protein
MIFTEKNNLKQKNIIILISPWRAPSFLYHFIKKIIPPKYGYIQYSYTDDILNADPNLTRRNFLQFIRRIIMDLNSLEKSKKRNLFLYGQSLGGLFCMIVADKIEVKRAMLVVPGANLAESFWRGNKTRELRMEMEKEGMSLKELKKIWQKISPDNYFEDKSRRTEFHIVLSIKDKTIPTSSGRKLVEILKRHHIKFDVMETFLSHRATCVKEAVFTENFCSCLIGER